MRDARDQLETKVQERTAELRQSNLELEESWRRLRMLTNAIPQQMWSTDADGNIEYCNQHLIDYIGSPMEGLVGEGFFRHLHPLDERLFRQVWRSALDAGKKFEVETRVLGADGTYRWFLIRSVPQHSIDGKLAHWYGIHIARATTSSTQSTPHGHWSPRFSYSECRSASPCWRRASADRVKPSTC